MDEERRQRDAERQDRSALVAVEPPQRAPAPEQSRPRRAAASSRPTRPVSDANWSGRLCTSRTLTLLLRSLRCTSSNEPAPVPSSGCPSKASQASFHQPQRLLRLPSLRRLGLWTDLLALQRVPARGDHADPDHEQRRGHAGGDAKQETLALRGSAARARRTPRRTRAPRRARTRARTRRRRAPERCAAGRPARSPAAPGRPRAPRQRGAAAVTNAARLSKRSRVSANQSPSTTSAARIPPREYVRTSATRSE